MNVHKSTLKRIKRLIEDAMDSEKTPSFDESWDCLYEAISELDELINQK